MLVSYLAWVTSHVGLDAEHEPGAFGAIVAPDGPENARAFVVQKNPMPWLTPVWTACMMIAVGLFDTFARAHGGKGLPGPLGLDRWHQMTEAARAAGALMESPTHYAPESADIVYVARADAAGHVAQHWFTLVRPDHSVDGGQQTRTGFQAVGESRRQFVPSNGRTLELTSGKPVVSVVRVAKLLEVLPC